MPNGLKTALLLGLLSGMLLLIGDLLGGQNGIVIAFIFAAVMNLGSYWFSDKIVLRMYRAQQVGPEHPLYRLTERLAQRGGLPMPKVYIIPDPSPNAFATGRNPDHAAVAATEGILRILTPEELEGVMAHELAHVKNRDILISTIAATFAGAISMIGSMLQWGAMFGAGRGGDEEGGGIGGMIGSLAMAIIAPIAAMLIQMAVSRSREYQADASGAEICGRPLALAGALRKLHNASQAIPMLDARPATAHMFIINPLTGGGMMALFSTHPPMEERISRLESLVTLHVLTDQQ